MIKEVVFLRRLSIQKVFSLVSFCFILSCVIFYGYRFTKLYINNHKTTETTSNSIAVKIKEDNFGKNHFQNLKGEYYFRGSKIDNNYIKYSNLIWRIIKLDYNNDVRLVLDNSITSLAYGKDITAYDDSYINLWLNNNSGDYTGILENNLNNVTTYLNKVNICIDEITTIESNCSKKNSDYYLGLLSIEDYIKAGLIESYLINGENIYLSNPDEEGNIWYINSEGKLNTTDGSISMGVRPVISLKGSLDYLSGDGSKNNPYVIENESSYFGGYVKLGDDIWRVYDEKDDELRLVLNDYIKKDGENLKLQFSYGSSYFNDTKVGTAPYYMNNNFLNNLSYKDIVKYTTWPNGYYGDSNDYDYKDALDTSIESKVAFLSIGNVIFDGLENYFLMSGITTSGSSIYTIQKDYKLFGKIATNKTYLVPTICIDKKDLTQGKGTINNPYER